MRRFFAMLALLCVSVSAYSTDQYDVRIDARVGFGGLFKAGRWTPVDLTLQNLGPGINGTLVVQLERRNPLGPDRHVSSFARNLELGAGAVKRFAMDLPLETGLYPLDIIIKDGDAVVDRRVVQLAGRRVTGSLVAALSRRTSLDFLLPVFNTRSNRAIDIVYPLPDSLPSTWVGYDGIDLLVAHDGRLRDLSPAQIRAIRDWVAAGGTLVVSGGAHLGPADSQSAAALSGAFFESVQVMSVRDLGLDQLGIAVEEEADEPVVVSQFRIGDSRIRVREHGRGRFVILPFDFAQLVRVAPLTSLGLWTSLLPREAVLGAAAMQRQEATKAETGIVPISVSRRVFETDVLANQLDLPVYDFPNRGMVGGLVLSFALAVLVLLRWSSRRTRPLQAGIGIALVIAAAAATSAVAHLALTIGLQPAEALSFSLEIARMGPGDGYAMVTRDTVLFSRKRADYRAAYTGSPVLVPLQSADLDLRISETARELQLPVSRWRHTSVQVADIVELPVSARIQRGVGYASIEVENKSEIALDGLVVLSNGFPTMIGRVMPGEIVEHVVMGNEVGKWEAVTWDAAVPADGLARHRSQLLRDIAGAQRQTEHAGLRLVAWTSRPFISEQISPAFAQRVEIRALVIEEPPQLPPSAEGNA